MERDGLETRAVSLAAEVRRERRNHHTAVKPPCVTTTTPLTCETTSFLLRQVEAAVTAIAAHETAESGFRLRLRQLNQECEQLQVKRSFSLPFSLLLSPSLPFPPLLTNLLQPSLSQAEGAAAKAHNDELQAMRRSEANTVNE